MDSAEIYSDLAELNRDRRRSTLMGAQFLAVYEAVVRGRMENAYQLFLQSFDDFRSRLDKRNLGFMQQIDEVSEYVDRFFDHGFAAGLGEGMAGDRLMADWIKDPKFRVFLQAQYDFDHAWTSLFCALEDLKSKLMMIISSGVGTTDRCAAPEFARAGLAYSVMARLISETARDFADEFFSTKKTVRFEALALIDRAANNDLHWNE